MGRLFIRELSLLWGRMGGARGLLMVAVLAVVASALPSRLGPALLAPLYLGLFSAMGALFAANYAIAAWTGETERAWLDLRPPERPSDSTVFAAKTATGALYGIAAWAVIFGSAIATLPAATVSSVPLARWAALLAWVAGLSVLAASAGAAMALRFEQPSLARQMLRLVFFFAVALLLVIYRYNPQLLQPPNRSTLPALLWTGAALTLLLAALLRLLALRTLNERSHRLTITDPGDS